MFGVRVYCCGQPAGHSLEQWRLDEGVGVVEEEGVHVGHQHIVPKACSPIWFGAGARLTRRRQREDFWCPAHGHHSGRGIPPRHKSLSSHKHAGNRVRSWPLPSSSMELVQYTARFAFLPPPPHLSVTRSLAWNSTICGRQSSGSVRRSCHTQPSSGSSCSTCKQTGMGCITHERRRRAGMTRACLAATATWVDHGSIARIAQTPAGRGCQPCAVATPSAMPRRRSPPCRPGGQC